MFVRGDGVRFKHLPGPVMFVMNATAEGVLCFWFDKNHAPRSHWFQKGDLDKVEAKPSDGGIMVRGQ